MSLPVATLLCRAQIGLEAPLVQVEVTVTSGLPAFHLVGLAATVVRESRARVQAALLSCGYEFPAGRIVVNLAPAEVPKEGGRFELPIALGILIASGQLAQSANRGASVCELYGELGLRGELKPVRGMLLAAAHASRDGHELIVPAANADEALIGATTPVRAASHLLEVCRHLSGEEPLHICSSRRRDRPIEHRGTELDIRDVRGQFQAKRALLIAAAGSHSLLKLLSIGPLQDTVLGPQLRVPICRHRRMRPAPIATCVSAPRNKPGAIQCAGRRRSPTTTPSATG